MDTSLPVQHVQISRADYECRYGLRPDEMAIGAVLCDGAGNPHIEFRFLTMKQEIATLEYLYNLDGN